MNEQLQREFTGDGVDDNMGSLKSLGPDWFGAYFIKIFGMW